ncbi:MAG: hypothetical protein WBK55_00725 [Alphaproteobacteria bacterium]
MQQETICETVGVFDDIESLNQAIAELEGTAFPRQDISVLDGAAMRKDGVAAGAIKPEDDPDSPRTILIRPEEKVIGGGVIVGGGLYAGVVTGVIVAGIGAPFEELASTGLFGGLFGAALGAVIAYLLGHYYNNVLREQIRKDQMVLWVRTPDKSQQDAASEIMRRHGGRRVHVH